MSARALVATVAAIVSLAVLVVWMSSGVRASGVTSESRAAAGLKGAVLAAEQLGVPAASWRRPIAELDAVVTARGSTGVLVVTLPLQTSMDGDDAEALQRWLSAGHTLVIQASGQAVDPSLLERLSALRLGYRKVPERSGSIAARAAPALWPSMDGAPPVMARPPARVAVDDAADRIWFGDRDIGAVRVRQVGPGRLVLIDGHALTNRWLARSVGNSGLWGQILEGADGVWFDDYHQGLAAIDLLARDVPRWPFHALLLHLALVWFAVIWATGRPFNGLPAASAPPRSSVAKQLRQLARVHAHHDHSVGAVASLRAHAGRALDDPTDDLLTVAQQVAALQKSGRLT